MCAVLEALRYVHGRGVLHRDVSAGNIFLSSTGQTKLTDFGVALAPDRLTSTAPGIVLGKAGYLSADRLRGRAASPADDLFALGIVLERMIAAGDPRERSSASAAPLRRLRETLGAAAETRENEADQRCRDAASSVTRASADEITEFFRSPAPVRRSSSAPQSPHVALDGTTISGEEVASGDRRHRGRATHRKE